MNPLKINKFLALKDHVIVRDMNFGERKTSGGIVLSGDDMRDAGIRPRWAQVFATGPNQDDVKVGDWICVKHGRWTRGLDVQLGEEKMTIRRVDNDEILLVSEEKPSDDTLGVS